MMMMMMITFSIYSIYTRWCPPVVSWFIKPVECVYIYIFICNHISGGQDYLLLAMDIAKVGGPLLVVKVCTSMLCVKIGYR